MLEIKSKLLKAVGFDNETERLYVIFRENEAYYLYKDVPEDIYLKMIDSESIGRFFLHNVREAFDFSRLFNLPEFMLHTTPKGYRLYAIDFDLDVICGNEGFPHCIV